MRQNLVLSQNEGRTIIKVIARYQTSFLELDSERNVSGGSQHAAHRDLGPCQWEVPNHVYKPAASHEPAEGMTSRHHSITATLQGS